MGSDFTERLRRRLVELGCPGRQVQRVVQEVAEHREDLNQAALLEGLSQGEAEARVKERLGDPFYLAEHQMAMLRRSTWWGRHSLLGFGILPILVVPLLWALLLGVGLVLEFALGYDWDDQKLHAVADNPVAFTHLLLAVNCADYLAIALVTFFFCWLARRSAVDIRWLLVSCAICSLCALFIKINLVPHNLSVGFSWPPQWINRPIVPLIIACVMFFRLRGKSAVGGGSVFASGSRG